ncbi:hypothetical protein MLD38_013197 [Melastoma candidum]|uniref:Uncharacterized protein n=1 Tax=Melastoma candidum TaxID=119954 RepID=A0ACB9R8R9_9MYRT|nr:hypothetical protein MLD38_013197 [Melastoma candidum]
MSRYSIELYFDPSLENQVLKSWNVLARRQISTHLIKIESRPHITLFSSLFVDPPRLEHALKSFCAKHDPLPITFFAIGSNSSEKNVLFLVPKPNVQLLQFQERLCEVLRKETGLELSEEFRVGGAGGSGGWAPWCAVGEEVSKGRMGEGFCVLREVVNLPVSGYGVDVGLVELGGPNSTVREVCSFVLGNGVDG